MKSEDLLFAFGNIDEKYVQAAEKAVIYSTTVKRKKISKRYFLIAALISLIGVISCAEEYQWRLPLPQIHESNNAIASTDAGDEKVIINNNNLVAESGMQLDELSKNLVLDSINLLKELKVEGFDSEEATIVKEFDSSRSREVIKIEFMAETSCPTFTYDQYGNFLSVTGMSGIYTAEQEVYTKEQLLEMAECYYKILPIKQHYQLSNYSLEDGYLEVNYYATAKDGTCNPFEGVRLLICEKNGSLSVGTIFQSSLVEEDGIGLSENEAIIIAEKSLSEIQSDFEDFILDESKKDIVQPNYLYTKYENVALDADGITNSRWAWVFRYTKSNSSGVSKKIGIYIDLFTGEVIGGEYWL